MGYRHDVTAAHQFVKDFAKAKLLVPDAKATIKIDEEAAVYLIGVGHAPFIRQAAQKWKEENPTIAAQYFKVFLDLIDEALQEGMDVVLEVSWKPEDLEE